MKKAFLKMVFLLCLMTFFSVGNAAELIFDNEKFGDYKWGQEVDSRKHEFLYPIKEAGINYYRLSGQEYSYGNVILTDVRFGIRSNTFFEGILIAEGKMKYDQLVGVLISRYGKPKLVENFQIWETDKLAITGVYNPTQDSKYPPEEQIGFFSILNKKKLSVTVVR